LPVALTHAFEPSSSVVTDEAMYAEEDIEVVRELIALLKDRE
jgi:hypothetical protein